MRGKKCYWFAFICLHVNDMSWADGNEEISFILLLRWLLVLSAVSIFLKTLFS